MLREPFAAAAGVNVGIGSAPEDGEAIRIDQEFEIRAGAEGLLAASSMAEHDMLEKVGFQASTE